MIQRLFYGLAWGIGLTIPACLGIFLLFFSIEKYDDYARQSRWDKEYIQEDIKNFKVISPSHRIIKGNDRNNGLYITGEISFDSFSSLNNYKTIVVISTLRNSDNGFVDECSYSEALKDIKNSIFKFKIFCEDVLTSDEFSNYEFRVEGILKN